MEPCRHYVRGGTCRYGDRCRFSHASAGVGKLTAAMASLGLQSRSAAAPVAATAPVATAGAAALNPSAATAPSATAAAAPSVAAAATPSSRKLYVDALNFGEYWFPSAGRRWSLAEPRALVSGFCAAAQRASIQVTAFIDEGVKTDSALGKWRARRQREVAKGEKRMPHGWSIVLGEMFRAAGVRVLYSLEEDCDDTLAFYADRDGADVLSADRDFYRYEGARYCIFHDFDRPALQHAGRLELLQRSPAHARIAATASSRRPLLDREPLLVPLTAAVPSMAALRTSRCYLRGAPSPLVRALGFNPHARVGALRRAVYHTLFSVAGGGDTPADQAAEAVAAVVIEESFPVWDAVDGCVQWPVAHVVPASPTDDPRSHALLRGSPQAAFAQLFPQEAAGAPRPPSVSAREWERHCFACFAVVAELICAAKGSSLLAELQARR